MTTFGRRHVLRTGALALGALALPAGPPQAGRRLVIVRLHGGADGLSMVAPWRDDAYRRARPTIALAPPGDGDHGTIDLDGTFALHPRLAPLRELFEQANLDIVPACGLATATRSHLTDGEALDRVLSTVGADTARPSSRDLRSQLSDIAARVRHGTAPAVSTAHTGGWDHHEGQRAPDGPLARALDDLAQGLAWFARTLGPDLQHTTIVTVSEFGRAVRENGLGGTDHGHATSVFVLGGGTRRGRIVGARARLDGFGVHPTVRLEDLLQRLA